MAMTKEDFQSVTELPGTPISREQIDRLLSRYLWASEYCRGKDVLEVGCGAGPGLGLLAREAASVEAGDISSEILSHAKRHYGDRYRLTVFDAENMPFDGCSKDVIVLFEALYYIPNADRFLSECIRILRPGGCVLVATANKDLWDFHPSAFSVNYYGVMDLKRLCENRGFEVEFFGFQPVGRSPWRQKILRPLKKLAVAANLMPKTMTGKRWLKRIVFGPEVRMPEELREDGRSDVNPVRLPSDAPDREHKVIYCCARLESLG